MVTLFTLWTLPTVGFSFLYMDWTRLMFFWYLRAPLAAKCLRTNMQNCWPSLKRLGRRSGPHMLEVRVRWRDWKEVKLSVVPVLDVQYCCWLVGSSKLSFLQRNNPRQGAGAWVLGWDGEKRKVLATGCRRPWLQEQLTACLKQIIITCMAFPLRRGSKNKNKRKRKLLEREKKNTVIHDSGGSNEYCVGYWNSIERNCKFLFPTFGILILLSYLNCWFMHAKGPTG